MVASGERFGPYELLGRLAALNISEVYLAREGGEPRALKIFRPEIAKRPFVDMLARERAAALDFRHPAAAATFRVGHLDKRAVIASEVIWGQTWAAVLRRATVAGQPLDHTLLLWVGARIAGVLEQAHRTPWTAREDGSMFHGRMALGHVLLTYSGEIKVVGVGFGRSMAMLPVSPSKLPYRAPEQATGPTICASDVYALGVCLYDAFTGKTTFKRASAEETLSAIAQKPVLPLEQELPAAPRDVAALVGRMMARDPAERPGAAEVAATLMNGVKNPDQCRSELSARMLDLFPSELKNSRAVRDEAFGDQKVEPYLSTATRAHSIPPPSPPDPSELPEMPAHLVEPDFRSVPSFDALRDPAGNAPDVPPDPAPSGPARGATLQVRVRRRERAEPRADAPTSTGPLRVGGPKVGDIVAGRYEVVRFVGRGGMAQVYQVRHALVNEDLAMKLLKPEALILPGVIERFEREARASARLDHENIVRVTDFGRSAGNMPFFVMELLEGPSLSEIISTQRRIAAAEAVALMEDVLAGLAHAHGLGVVHRDMKPDNVMLSGGGERKVAKILDFGIAQVRSTNVTLAGHKLTLPGMTLGTPAYMAPEQAVGDAVDARTDLFAVGVMLYELLAGVTPFAGDSAVQVMTNLVTKPPPPLRAPQLPRPVRDALEAVIFRALAKSRSERFRDAGEMRAALAACGSGTAARSD